MPTEDTSVAVLALRMATKAMEMLHALSQSLPELQDGKDGKDGAHGVDGKNGIIGKEGAKGLDGVQGQDGLDGEAGKLPDHEIKGNSIRFERSDGTWGAWVELPGSSRGGGGVDFWQYAIHTFTTATVQLKDIHSTVLCDATAQGMTVSLPRAGSLTGRVVTVKKIDSSANPITIEGYESGTSSRTSSSSSSWSTSWSTSWSESWYGGLLSGAETVDGGTTTNISQQWTSLRLQSDGNNWVTV